MSKRDDICSQELSRQFRDAMDGAKSSTSGAAKDTTIAELRAEVAALKARPAMPWRRREDVGEVYEGDRFAVAIHIHSTAGGKEEWYWNFACVQIGDHGDLLTDEGDCWGWRFSDVDFVIPWADLMPPGVAQ